MDVTPTEKSVPQSTYAYPDHGGYFKNGKPKKNLTARQMFEKYQGPIAKGNVVYHVDGDNTNFHRDNLMQTSRINFLNMVMSKPHTHGGTAAR